MLRFESSLTSIFVLVSFLSFSPFKADAFALVKKRQPQPSLLFTSSRKQSVTEDHASNCATLLKETYSEHDDDDQVWMIQEIQQQYTTWQHQTTENSDESVSSSSSISKQLSTDSITMDTAATAAADATNDALIYRARLLLLAAAALYGTNFSLVKLLGETNMPIGACSTLRFGLASLATFPWLFTSTQSSSKGTTTSATAQYQQQLQQTSTAVAATVAGLEVGLWNSIGYVAQAIGLETTAASKSAFLCSLAVVVVPLLDMLLGKFITKSQLVGLVLAMAGVALLELGGATEFTQGDMVSFIQPLAFGMGFWRMEQAMHKFPDQANRSTAAQLLAVFVASAMFCSITDPGVLTIPNIQLWLQDRMVVAGLLWTGCVTTALTVYMETIALQTLSAAETTLILSTEPLWGTAFAALIMGEQLGMNSGVGAAMILVGCVVSNLGFDGIKAFFVAANSKGTDSDEAESKIDPIVDTTLSTYGALGGIWSSLAIGLKVCAFQVQDALEDISTMFDG
jgi:drug/metabolite transporter (DMT)-like permease